MIRKVQKTDEYYKWGTRTASLLFVRDPKDYNRRKTKRTQTQTGQ